MENSYLPESVYENLPQFLKELTNPFDGREKDIVFLSSIGVISASLPKVFGVYSHDTIASNLFVLIVAGPASGKGVMNNSKVLIEQIHDEIMNNSLSDIEDCQEQKSNSKSKKQKCPELEIKLIPGNASSSKFYKHMNNSTNGVLIFESEADTLSNMMKQDWGDFSDVLRKAFHHETLSITRDIDDRFFEIRNPKLSLVISGTPNQLKSLLKSVENGLFSRFLIYYFDDATGWKDVSPNGVKADYKKLFKDAGGEMYNLYRKLEANQTDIEVKLTNEQWVIFNEKMSYVTKLFLEQNREKELAILKRQGLMFFRICLILTIVRIKDNLYFESVIICDERDFRSALEIIKATIDHSIRVSNLMALDEKNSKVQMTVRETMLYSGLQSQFKRDDAILLGTSIEIPKRTIDYMLKKWITDKRVSKVFNGVYQKTI